MEAVHTPRALCISWAATFHFVLVGVQKLEAELQPFVLGQPGTQSRLHVDQGVHPRTLVEDQVHRGRHQVSVITFLGGSVHPIALSSQPPVPDGRGLSRVETGSN